MTAFYKQTTKSITDYHKIEQLDGGNRKFGIFYSIDTKTKSSYYTGGYVFDTFREAERALYKHRPGSRRFA